MRRLLVFLIASILLATGCGGSDETADSTTTTSAATTTTTTGATTSTTTTPTTTTTTTVPERALFDDSYTTALFAGPASWDRLFIDPGGVVVHDDQWHRFYNGIDSWPSHVSVGYATSPDGLKWTKKSDEPLFVTDEADYTGISAFLSHAEVLDDGTWAVWFYSVERQNNFATGVVGRATAPTATGPWTIDPAPAVEKGAEGEWDSQGVSNPSIVKGGDEWWMYYDGNKGDLESDGDRSIGLATSTDGITWEKHADNPIMVTQQGEWDERRVYDPGVVITDEGFVMAYWTRRPGKPGATAPEYLAGLAFSEDGLSWERDPDNPFYDTSRFGNTQAFLSTFIHTGDAYVLLHDVSTGGGTNVWQQVHEGSLRDGG